MAPKDYDAVLLASFGGPEGQDDVIPFLRNVTRGRGIPDERLEEVSHHYRANGGISPINQQNRELKAGIEAELAARGIELPVFWGNRNWAPYIPQTLQDIYDAGHRKVLMVTTSAYSCYSSCRQYREDIGMALTETGLDGKLEVDKVRQYFDHPGFVEPFIEGTAAGLAEVRAQLAAAGNAGRAGAHPVRHALHPHPRRRGGGPLRRRAAPVRGRLRLRRPAPGDRRRGHPPGGSRNRRLPPPGPSCTSPAPAPRTCRGWNRTSTTPSRNSPARASRAS